MRLSLKVGRKPSIPASPFKPSTTRTSCCGITAKAYQHFLSSMYPLPDSSQAPGYQTNLPPIDLLSPLLAEPPDLSALRDEPSWNRVREHAGRYGVAALVAHAARPHVSPAE